MNDSNHDLVRFDANVNSTMRFHSPGWGLDVHDCLRDSFQYPESGTASLLFPENEIAPSTARGHSVDGQHLVDAKEKVKVSEPNIEPGQTEKPNMPAENLDYVDPTSNTDLWAQSDSNGFESFEYWVLRDALDPDLLARSLSLFQAEWQRKNVPRSPGVISNTTTGESTSETVVTSSEANATSQKESRRHLGKHNLPAREPDEGDETEDERRRKKQKQARDTNKPYDGPRFACPFYKKDPSKYCPSTIVGGTNAGDKYANCHKYASIELHRLVR